jgi:hypothetical protein
MLIAIYQSVFRPSAFCQNPRGRLLIDRYGWIFIAVRWLYYSIVFSLLRDYHGAWKPFYSPPFGLSIDTYATLQRLLSPVFGFLLMGAIAGSLVAYLRTSGKEVPVFRVFNILDVTFFLPFVFLQPLDLIAVTTINWSLIVIPPLHTLVLVWEAVATMLILDWLYRIGRRERIVGVVLIVGVWILIAELLWR